MEDFQSKYSGEQVEEMLDQIANGDIGGGITAETDPIFSASPAASITEEKKTEWDNKVDKVSGKQLTTEDFTSTLKNKLEGLSNYDDTELSEALTTLREDFDKLVSGDTTTAIKTFNEVIAFLDGIQDTQDLSSIIASIEQQIAGKMDKVTLATVATSGSYNDLSNKPTIPAEQVNADWNATSGKAQILNKPTIPTSLSQLNGDSTHRVVTDTEKSTWNSKSDFDGDYNSLKNKPTIPTAVTESTVRGWGFTKNKGTYSKPSTGIPKTDLASAVQTSLGKADNAFTGTINGSNSGSIWVADKININGTGITPDSTNTFNLGTVVKSVKANGTAVAVSNGEVNIPAASTSVYGVTKLSSSTSSTSTSLAATASAVKEAYDLANGKQEKLTSGTNIKTINGQSILGNGDITIEGGSEDSKIYILEIRENSGGKNLSQEEFDALMSADMVYSTNLGGIVNFDSEDESNYWFKGTVLQDNTYKTGTIRIKKTNLFASQPSYTEDRLATESFVQEGKEIVSVFNGVIEELVAGKIYIMENSDDGVFEIQSIVEPEVNYQEFTVFIYAEPISGSFDNYQPTIILPEGVYWANGVIPDITQPGCYELSIAYTCGLSNGFYNAVLTRFYSI